MRNKRIITSGCKLLAALLLLLPATGFSQLSNKTSADAAATAKAFFTFHFKNKFDYSARGLRLRQRWLDTNLYRLLIAADKKARATKDDVPELDGDPFTNSQEYPDTFKIGDTKEEYGKAMVEVVFLWKDKGKVVDERNVQVELVKEKNLWKISNIIDKTNEDGDLVKFLKRIT